MCYMLANIPRFWFIFIVLASTNILRMHVCFHIHVYRFFYHSLNKTSRVITVHLDIKLCKLQTLQTVFNSFRFDCQLTKITKRWPSLHLTTWAKGRVSGLTVTISSTPRTPTLLVCPRTTVWWSKSLVISFN